MSWNFAWSNSEHNVFWREWPVHKMHWSFPGFANSSIHKTCQKFCFFSGKETLEHSFLQVHYWKWNSFAWMYFPVTVKYPLPEFRATFRKIDAFCFVLGRNSKCSSVGPRWHSIFSSISLVTVESEAVSDTEEKPSGESTNSGVVAVTCLAWSSCWWVLIESSLRAGVFRVFLKSWRRLGCEEMRAAEAWRASGCSVEELWATETSRAAGCSSLEEIRASSWAWASSLEDLGAAKSWRTSGWSFDELRMGATLSKLCLLSLEDSGLMDANGGDFSTETPGKKYTYQPLKEIYKNINQSGDSMWRRSSFCTKMIDILHLL